MSSTEIAIDIIVSNHNYARFLPAAVESARAQDHPRVNVIVVDDGSTDESSRVLAKYEGGIDVIRKENGGQASALNAGLSRGTGEIAMLLDADDVLRPHAAARIAEAFAADDRAVKAQFRLDVIDADGAPTGALKPASYRAMPHGDLRAAELAFPYDIAWLPTSATAFRRTALEPILPIPERLYPAAGADWYLNHLTALLGPIVSIDEVLGSYRVHDANSYEPRNTTAELTHLRQTIEFAQVTSDQLLRLAARLRLPHPERILSIADLANRITSLRLDASGHPVSDDSLVSLLADAMRAARRRETASLPIKAAFLVWFAAMAVVPSRLVRPLADLFLFPERRRALNPLLVRLQRPGGATGSA